MEQIGQQLKLHVESQGERLEEAEKEKEWLKDQLRERE